MKIQKIVRFATRTLPPRIPLSALAGVAFLTAGNTFAGEFTVTSPNGKITATLTFDEDRGALAYRVESDGREIITSSPIGIVSDHGDFRTGMELAGTAREVIDETYSLPQGKVSTYHNRANELVVELVKDDREIRIRFRAYDDGTAFRFVIPGEGDITFHEESNAIHLAGEDFTFWGQEHPNRYGYEHALGPIDGERMSIPVLAHLEDQDHFVLMAQAATYGHYIQPHFERSGPAFRYRFPLDQERLGPVTATLPFESPWRMIIISSGDAGRIVESYLSENLNPPTDPGLLDADRTVKDWVRPGRVMWDFIAGDRNDPTLWIDAAAEMGWEYYLADAGFANRWGGGDAVREATAYAEDREVGVIGWAHTRNYDTREKAAANMERYADWGLKGAKIDFFDHNTLDENPREWRDHEDTQQSLRMRDWIFELGIENKFLLELHGNTMPTGERRRFPHLMTLEGVDGMERGSKPASNDLTIPYVRNVMGPVSYTVIHFDRSPGTHAYQLAMPVVYEAGLMIYAEHGQKLIEWAGRELIRDVPSSWDEIRFIEGKPGTHIIVARRNGPVWYIGGMTDSVRTTEIALDFLDAGRNYEALIFRDETETSMRRETRSVKRTDTVSVELLERGGFAIRLTPGDND